MKGDCFMKFLMFYKIVVTFSMMFLIENQVFAQNVILCKTIKTDVCKTIGIVDAKERNRFVDSLLSSSLQQGKVCLLEALNVAETYLNDPNSLYRDEEAYIPFLEYAIHTPALDKTEKTRYRFHLKMAYKNRVGTKATDFSYITREGEKGRVDKLYKHSSGNMTKRCNVLLYFNNPECYDCNRTFGYLSASKVINDKLAAGSLILLALYPDEDLGAWKRHKDEYPKNWIVARYASSEERTAYYLPAIPCFYLLDTTGKVLLKDAPVDKIEDALRHLKDAQR